MVATPHTDENLSDLAKPQLFLMPYSWLVIPVLAVLLYANTLTHDYTQDDAIVIYENMYTTQGIDGIPSLLSFDTFRGFFKTEGKDKLVSGGRYRPLTPVMFAIEYELFGRSPFVGHLFNILYYALLGWILYLFLYRLLTPTLSQASAHIVALACCMLYIAHPIHTEAVANIKGRDEIVAMLCSVSSCYMALKYLYERKISQLLAVFGLFFLGLLSKENTITFLAVWPLAVYCFQRSYSTAAIRPWLAMFGATLLFLVIRTAVLGFDFGGTPMELMNNPYLQLQEGQYVALNPADKYATITYTLGKYVQLLAWPHPLTHDYYPRHIDVMSFADTGVVASAIVYLSLLVVAVWSFRIKPTVSFAVLYFFVTLSIVSNVVFPIGTNMSERFMFMPSLGFTLLLAYLIFQEGKRWLSPNTQTAILALLIIGYSVKTVSRNTVWKNDFTLFTTDVKTSSNSAKVLNAAGGALTTEAGKLPDGPKKTKMLDQAVQYLKKALTIHPGYKNAALILGNAHIYRRDYSQAITAYESALYIAPGYPEAETNLAIALREAGKYAGETEGDVDKALRYLTKSIQLSPDDVETLRLLGIAHGISGDHESAVKYFTQVANVAPSKAAYENLARAYGNSGDQEAAGRYFQLANEQ